LWVPEDRLHRLRQILIGEMSTDRVVQPMVACLGYPVAGDPTQFVMSRIAREAGLDWRFFTSEVEPEYFETAFRGVQALGMAGVSILEPFQQAAVPFLKSLSSEASLLGRASVARREAEGWVGDHTQGLALMQLLRARLGGYSLREDGTMSPQSILVIGSRTDADMLEGLTIQLEGDLRVLWYQDEAPNPSVCEKTAGVSVSSKVQSVGCDELSSLERPVRVLLFDGASMAPQSRKPKSLMKWFQQIAWATSPVVVCTQGRRQLDDGALDWFKGREVPIVEELEMMAYRTAVDFHFWTGYEPSIELIRESLEEYLQW
jgi:hypothetical protein